MQQREAQNAMIDSLGPVAAGGNVISANARMSPNRSSRGRFSPGGGGGRGTLMGVIAGRASR